MLYLTIKTTILSIIFIFIVHNVIYYFKDNLTIPKTKDLITITEKKYDDIHKTLNIINNYSIESDISSVSSMTTSIKDLPKPTDTNTMHYDINLSHEPTIQNNMKDELKCFIKQHQM